MKIVSDLYEKVKDVKFYKSQFTIDENKQNILFVDPLMSSFDFYSMIVPYLCLEETDRYKTAITGMYRYSELESKPQTVISESEVSWSDVIVLPMSLEMYFGENGLVEEIKKIKPEIKIIQTCEFDFYEITNEHYLLQNKKLTPEQRKELKAKMIERYENNFKSADRIIVLNEHLKSKLESMGFNDVKYIPILIDEDSFKENIDFSDTLGIKNTPGIVFMSVELNENTISAFKTFVPYFINLCRQHKEKFRLVIIGDNPKKYFKKIEFEYDHISKGSIIHQFKAVVKSSADFHLVLNKKSTYSINSESICSFVERGLFGIPVATMDVPPYNEFIDEHTGFILKTKPDLQTLIHKLLKKKENLVDISQTLKSLVVSRCQITEEKINHLGYLFFDEYSKIEEDENED
jgi:hypothetical protein